MSIQRMLLFTSIAARSSALLPYSYSLFGKQNIFTQESMCSSLFLIKSTSKCNRYRSPSISNCRLLSIDSERQRYTVPAEEAEVEIKVKNSLFISTASNTPSVESARFTSLNSLLSKQQGSVCKRHPHNLFLTPKLSKFMVQSLYF